MWLTTLFSRHGPPSLSLQLMTLPKTTLSKLAAKTLWPTFHWILMVFGLVLRSQLLGSALDRSIDNGFQVEVIVG